MDLQFRLARADEVGALTTLVTAYFDYDRIAYEREEIERALRKLVGKPELGTPWFIEVDGQSIGYFILATSFDVEFGGSVGVVTDLYLEAPYRRRGIGKKALAFVEEKLRERGIGALEIQAERENTKAVAFYTSYGMKAHDRVSFSKIIPSP